MIDTQKRRSIHVLGTGSAATAGLTTVPATVNLGTPRIEDRVQTQLTGQGGVHVPGELFGTRNVHTTEFPDGDLRDQLCAAKELNVGHSANIHATSNSIIDITGSGKLETDLMKENTENGEDEC